VSNYSLSINLGVTELDERGSYLGQGLRVEEHAVLGSMGFMEIAGLLARFNELTEVIRVERGRAEARPGDPPRTSLDVTLWLTGMVMVFGPDGDQLPDLQGSWAKAMPVLLDRDDVDYHVGIWPDWRRPATRTHMVLLGNNCGWWPPAEVPS
jgi:hypothetical protein